MQVRLITELNVTSAPVKLNWTQQFPSNTNRIQLGSRTAADDTSAHRARIHSDLVVALANKLILSQQPHADLYKYKHNHYHQWFFKNNNTFS